MKTAQTLLVALCLTSPCLITAPSHAAACANGAQGGSVTLLTDGFQAVCGDKIYSNFVGLSGLNSSGTPATWSIDENPSVGLHSFLVSGLKQSTPIAYSYKITITSASKFAGMATTSSIVAPLGITPTGVKNLSTLSYISTSTDGNNSGQVVFSPSVVGTLAFSGTLKIGRAHV